MHFSLKLFFLFFFFFYLQLQNCGKKKKFVATFVVDSSVVVLITHTNRGATNLRTLRTVNLFTVCSYQRETCLANMPFTIGHADKASITGLLVSFMTTFKRRGSTLIIWTPSYRASSFSLIIRFCFSLRERKDMKK